MHADRPSTTASYVAMGATFVTAAWLATATLACGTSRDVNRPDGPVDDASLADASGLGEGTGDASFDVHAPLAAAVLVSGQQTPVGIALDDLNVYWMNLGTYSGSSGTYSGAQLMKCAKAGCGNAPTVLASGSWNRTTRLAVASGHVYWATQNLLLSCPTDGCAASGPTTLWASPLAPTDIAVDEATVYFGDSIGNRLMTCPIGGCSGSPAVLWSSSEPPTAIALDGATVYFATVGISLLSCAASGCAPVIVGGTPTAIAVAGTSICLGTRTAGSPGAIASCPATHCSAGLTLLTSRVSYCQGIAADATEVYFTDLGIADGGGAPSGTGRVSKCPIAGCDAGPTPVAGFVSFPQQIAVDDTTVYWTDFGSGTDPRSTTDGRVMAIPR
jgi:hypothetical protein